MNKKYFGNMAAFKGNVTGKSSFISYVNYPQALLKARK